MSVPTSQPLSAVVPVTVVFSAPGSPGLPFNQGLIVGNSTVINSVTTRVELFTSLNGLVTAGFSQSSAEYLAAEIYFGQDPAPSNLWIGVQDLTAINTATVAATAAKTITVGNSGGTGYVTGNEVSISGVTGSVVQVTASGGVVTGVTLLAGGQSATVANNIATTNIIGTGSGLTIDVTAVGSTGGTGYVVGDIVTVTQSGASGGQLRVSTISAGGVVTGLQTITGSQGTSYTVAYGLPVTGGTGTGLEVNITAVGETPLEAVTSCRLAQYLWYCCMFVGSHFDGSATTNADYEAIAAYIEAASPASTLFITDGESATLNGSLTSLPANLQASAYRRTNTTYSTTQSGSAPNNIYASAAPMGLAMGLNTATPGSYFSLSYKQMAGVIAEPLNATQTNNVCGNSFRTSVGQQCNVCVDYASGAYVSLYQFATQASGNFFDEILQLDMLANNIQTTVFNYFTTARSIPITDAGATLIKNLVQQCCVTSQQIGFIAPSGVWQGATIGTGNQQIYPGKALPQGYAIYTPSVLTLSAQQKANRQMPPVTVALIESGSGISQVVVVNVQA